MHLCKSKILNTHVVHKSQVTRSLIFLEDSYLKIDNNFDFIWQKCIYKLLSLVKNKKYFNHFISFFVFLLTFTFFFKFYLIFFSTSAELVIFIFLGISMVRIRHQWNAGFIVWSLIACIISRVIGKKFMFFLARKAFIWQLFYKTSKIINCFTHSSHG